MARRKIMKIQPAITDLYFIADTASAGDSRSYIDTMRELSRVNRRLYEQGRMVAYQGLTYIWRDAADYDAGGGDIRSLQTIEVTVRTAGNTWVVHNAYVKGKALWNEMQDLVLDDNPSVKGKWHDFKVQLSPEQVVARQLSVKDGAGTDVIGGEWNISTYVMPQHEVDTATGEPLAAVELTPTLIGIDTTTKRSLVKAYQQSRATVQPLDPNVPVAMSSSFFNLLTDSGSQEPELADVIEDENDQPPYDTDEYVGGGINGPTAMPVQYGAISSSEVDGRIGPFLAPCGLIEIDIKGYDNTGVLWPTAQMPVVDLLLHVAPGTYKGVAAVPMGQ
jgi:hypothetical protein